MNKARRHELKILKYKKRLKLIKAPKECVKNPKATVNGVPHNYTAYRSHGAPCSCSVCSHQKYERAKVNRSKDGKSEIKRYLGMKAM